MQAQLRTFGYSIWLIYFACYLTLFAVSLVVMFIIPAQQRLIFALLLALYGLLFAASLWILANGRFAHLYFVAQSVIIALLLFINPHAGDVLTILLFPLAAQGPLLLPLVPGFVWVLAFVVLSVLGHAPAPTAVGISETILSMTAYVGFGAFGGSLRQSQQAHTRSQTLLTELQAAHRQLQAYTQQAEKLAVADERSRLAREMHDALGHRLTVAVVQLEGAKRLIPTEPERAATIVDSMRTQLKEALAELRQTVSALRTPLTSNDAVEDLPTAVSTLIHTFESATSLPIHLKIDTPLPPITSAQRRALFRAAQESLTNVQRHAQATAAWVHLGVENGRISLTTQDNGSGYPAEFLDGRFGLLGLRERADALGGTVNLSQSPQGGAQLQFDIPLQVGADE